MLFLFKSQYIISRNGIKNHYISGFLFYVYYKYILLNIYEKELKIYK